MDVDTICHEIVAPVILEHRGLMTKLHFLPSFVVPLSDGPLHYQGAKVDVTMTPFCRLCALWPTLSDLSVLNRRIGRLLITTSPQPLSKGMSPS